MRIVFCSAEVVPFTKTGGLADVAGSLPQALEELGHELIVITPYYKAVKRTDVKPFSPNEVSVAKISKNIKVYLVGNEKHFGRDGIYGDKSGDYADNLERFSYYCHESLRLLKRLEEPVDVIHCHDWHTALIPVLLKNKYQKDPFFKNIKSVFTIHNLAYQGVFPKEQYELLSLDRELFHIDGFEFYDQINVMKAGIIFADRVTTVSPQYALEIQHKEYGCGLDGVLRTRPEGIAGIINGLDYDIWNPGTDPLIESHYSSADWSNKANNKASLQKAVGLPEKTNVPLFGFVGRLCHQKGLDLLIESIEELMRFDVQLVFVGSGGDRYHRLLEACAAKYPEKIGLFLKFGEEMARRTYAASDFFLMPSVYEPCGLGQMISLCYGTIPLVHRTGGLADTISAYDPLRSFGNGFVFFQYTKEGLVFCFEQAVRAYKNPPQFNALVKRAFESRFTWDNSALEYEKIYREGV
ncbi:MAG: glycogen synthase GlgA [Candidatus Omnitrophica bacterium]|nr:glycogen synthase GlgA [Candidatus Omnitrophota bacterium]